VATGLGIQLVTLARVKQDLVVRLTAFGLAAAIGRDRLFPALPTAVAAYRQWPAGHKQHPGENKGTPDAA